MFLCFIRARCGRSSSGWAVFRTKDVQERDPDRILQSLSVAPALVLLLFPGDPAELLLLHQYHLSFVLGHKMHPWMQVL